MLKKITDKILNLSVFKLFLSVLVINFVLIGLAVIFYHGKFLFWEYPFSYAGTVKTVFGAENMISSYLYSSAMVLSGLTMFVLAYHFYKNGHNLLRTMLCFMCGSGFLIAGFNPDDIRHGFHVLGSALLVATFWILATNYTFEVRRILKRGGYYFLQIILQIPIFAYAGFYFFNIEPTASIVQKFAITGLAFALLYSTKLDQKNQI